MGVEFSANFLPVDQPKDPYVILFLASNALGPPALSLLVECGKASVESNIRA